MLKSSKSNKYTVPLFVSASLGTFLVIGILLLFWKLEWGYRNMEADIAMSQPSSEKIYINTDYAEDDPYITKNPSLKDMLAGPIITDLDPSTGDKYAPVVIVYFADFECDFCRKQEQILKRILLNYKYKTKLVWKDYPENDQNTASFRAALAARCAFEQGAFWPYHDFLYEYNADISRETFNKIADMISIDRGKFDECLDASRPKKAIYDNIEEADALGINGIPFMYVNDQEVMGETSYEDLEKIVKIELEKAENKGGAE
ncbi:MAG: DsbA family protein [Candidatus Falkowbacteria bacterium]